jgi:hypothetical protein
MNALAARGASSAMERHARSLDKFLVPRLKKLPYL